MYGGLHSSQRRMGIIIGIVTAVLLLVSVFSLLVFPNCTSGKTSPEGSGSGESKVELVRQGTASVLMRMGSRGLRGSGRRGVRSQREGDDKAQFMANMR